MSDHLSDLVFDALRIGAPEISAEDRAHLEGCAHCKARRRMLDAAAQDFVQRFDLAGLAADALSKSKPQKTRWWTRAWIPALASSVAAAALIVIVSKPEIRSKGAAPLAEIFVIDGDAKHPIEGAVPADARLAVRVASKSPKKVRILWGSAPDRWSALYPEEPAPAWTIRGPTWLEREVVLDGAKETELLGVVACEHDVSHRAAVEALKQRAPEGCAVQTIEVIKR